MKKLLNFYRTLKPEIRVRIIFYVLLSLIWVPVHKDVEVYEPYRYDIDDVEENQVVFACHKINYAWGTQEYIWVVQKDGTCRIKDLSEQARIRRERAVRKDYEPEKLTDEEFLTQLDQYMQDETLPKTEKQFKMDKNTLNYLINISDIQLRRSNNLMIDGGSMAYYVVCGTGEERHLKLLQEDGEYLPRYTNDYKTIRVCAEIAGVH